MEIRPTQEEIHHVLDIRHPIAQEIGDRTRPGLFSSNGLSTEDQVERIFNEASWEIWWLVPENVDYELSLCRIKIVDHPTGADESHAKTFSVDRNLFYIGSQNLYPSGIGNDGLGELSEHGFMVDSISTPVSDRYHNDVAMPTWIAGLADGMWLQSGCDQVLYPTRLQGSASNGFVCDVNFDTEFDFNKSSLEELADFYGEGECSTGGYIIDIAISGEIPITGIPATYGEIRNGSISGSLRGTTISASAPLTGTFRVTEDYLNVLEADFDGLTLDVTYSGTITRD